MTDSHTIPAPTLTDYDHLALARSYLRAQDHAPSSYSYYAVDGSRVIVSTQRMVALGRRIAAVIAQYPASGAYTADLLDRAYRGWVASGDAAQIDGVAL